MNAKRKDRSRTEVQGSGVAARHTHHFTHVDHQTPNQPNSNNKMSKVWKLPTKGTNKLRFSHLPLARHLSHFTITSHTTRTQHTRDRPAGAERGRHNDLRLHVNQYVPRDNPNPKAGDVTLIGAHANGFPKELYEPFWNDLYQRLRAKGRGVRGIWIADIASQGQSGILNEEILGPDGKSFSFFY
jgi:hypothetical protein